jgi:trehalose-phosphatase
MLDYDGTLAPFRVDRERATPSPGVMPALRAIAESSRTRIAIVSGRRLDQLESLLGALDAVRVGEHGWEEHAPGQETLRHPLPEGTGAALEGAAAAASARGWADHLERKRASIVLHTRDLARDRAAEIEQVCSRLWAHAGMGLRLTRIDGGLELRVSGRHKGTAVRDLMARSQPGTLPVYVGDDATDEDAFEAVMPGGLGIRVGQDDRPTLARARIRGPEAVADFLESWLRKVEGREPPKG